MAGHSKWANTKHRKARIDQKRGKIFSKIAKEIMVAARDGGGDPAANIALRALITKAKSYNMPADNLDRAIKKGTGDLDGVVMEEITYEGYASGGVAVLVQVLTDNKNRSISEVRQVFTKNNGNMDGSVAHLFQRKGQIFVNAEGLKEVELLEILMEAGGENMVRDGDSFEILTGPTEFMQVVDALDAAGIESTSSELVYLPDLEIPISDEGQARSMIRFMDAMEDLDDVQSVYANFNIDDDVMDAIGDDE